MDYILRSEEKAIFKLRSLYESYGYCQFKMSKFEEYDLYTRNKDFLVSDSIITFTDTSGALMALKPDVTLSIIKDSADVDGSVKKVYYNENVYRVSKGTQSFKEIMQAGLECIGDVDEYIICETLYLAAKSLESISADFILDISDMEIISEEIKALAISPSGEKEILKCLGEKNIQGIKRVCAAENADQKAAEILVKTASLYGGMKKVASALKEIGFEKISPYVSALEKIADYFDGSGLEDRIHFDFSVIHDINYYNGIVFKGFINTIPTGILSGGQYDGLMRKMKRNSSAIGFAVYLDLLERLPGDEEKFDVDALLLYDERADAKTVKQAVDMLSEKNISVSAQKKIPENLRYMSLYRLGKGGPEKVE